MVLLILILLLAVLYMLSVRGRVGNPGLEPLRGWSYAHRGLHNIDAGIPENSLAAFRAALERGYGAELDVHLLKDGHLAVIHDAALKRTTGLEGCIEDLTLEDLKNCHLDGTEETIPSFREVLDTFAGKTPLIVELKPENGNHAALCEAACAMLADYNGLYCMESFDPRCIYWLRKNKPQIVRGQLSEDFVTSTPNMGRPLAFMLTHSLSHFLTQPDFTAYRFDHRSRTPSNFLCRKLWGVQGVSWTLKTQEEYDTAVKEGWIPIFENFAP